MPIKYFYKASSVFRQYGLRTLIKRSAEEIGRPIISQRIKSKNNTNNLSELPKLIELDSSDIKWNSSFSQRLFPTADYIIEKKETNFDQPIVGTYGGRWDKCRRTWNESDFHKSLLLHFNENTNVKNKSKNDLFNHNWKANEELYNSMKKYGYIPQAELIKNPEKNKTRKEPSEIEIRGEKYPDECRVGIGRNGEIMRFGGGNHRVSIAKILELDDIVALLVVRHKEWKKIRDDIDENGLSEEYEELSSHPDLQDILD